MATKPAGKSAAAAKQKRDVTRALAIVNSLRNVYDAARTNDTFGELEDLLRTIDARTGRRDPSKRARRSAKKSAKRPPKKARARR